MDQQRFDDLARAVARGAPRRNVLKGLVAGLASMVLGAGVVEQVSANVGPCPPGPADGRPICNACEKCERQNPRSPANLAVYACVPKCDACSHCNPGPGGPLVGVCRSTCQRCEVCDYGHCDSRCGPHRVCVDNNCVPDH